MNRSVRNGYLIPVLLCAAAGVLQPAQAADASATVSAGPPVPARWVTRKFGLTFMGFTAHYSCDGLRDNLRDILLQLGARKEDLKLREVGCVRLDGPTPMPRVEGSFAVLVPVSELTPKDVLAPPPPKAPAGSQATGDPVPARWHSVDLVRNLRYQFDLTGNCELLEQVKKEVLPLVSSRNLTYHSVCIPYTATAGGVNFKLDVLVPPQKEQVARAE